MCDRDCVEDIPNHPPLSNGAHHPLQPTPADLAAPAGQPRNDTARPNGGPREGGAAAGPPELPAALYDQLRAVAWAMMRHQPTGQTLQATAVVHEAWLRLARSGVDLAALAQAAAPLPATAAAGPEGAPGTGEAPSGETSPGSPALGPADRVWLPLASRIIRHVIIDHIRRRNREKRGGGRRLLSLDEHQVADGDSVVTIGTVSRSASAARSNRWRLRRLPGNPLAAAAGPGSHAVARSPGSGPSGLPAASARREWPISTGGSRDPKVRFAGAPAGRGAAGASPTAGTCNVAPAVTVGGRLSDLDLLALDEALDQLGQFGPRQMQVVEMKFFGQMTTRQIAEALEVSTRTVEDDWAAARAWLRQQLTAVD